ncbi:fat-body protein 1 [Lucilia sericata]|uniref:fat-body protein 1 n=1 Tax=Lucilia sericata TaxID=13632 RepID=UPI0018A8737C|nr:fat-body protein 1 [Lucilia sericata]
MQRIVIVLLGLASLVAGGVILDRGRVGLTGQVGLGLQTMQGISGGVGGMGIGIGSGTGQTLSRDELLRQKFILDVLHLVYQPLQQQDLLQLDDPNTVANEDLYMRPLTREMLMVLDLIRNNQMLGKQTICRITNDLHMQQMLGLYRLMVNARDFQTFQHLVVYARQNVNTEMFVNSLILALGERNDTQNLIVPALYEVLAEIYQQDQVINQVIDQVHQMESGTSSVRPQLMDVIGMGHQNRFLADQQQQQGGFLGILNKSQLWMPWREFHRQLAWRKMMLGGKGPGMMGGNVVQQQGQIQQDKLEIPLTGNGLLSQDIGLKAYVNILIDELIVNQDIIRNSQNQQPIGIGGSLRGRGQMNRAGNDNNMHSSAGILGGRGQLNTYGGLGGNRNYNDDNDYQQGGILSGRRDNTLGGGFGRNRGDNDDNDYQQGGILSGRRDNTLGGGQTNTLGGFGRNRGDNDDNNYQQGGGRRGNAMGEGVNTDRLLFIGRRQRGNDIGVNDDFNRNNMGGRRIGVDTDEMQGNSGRRLGGLDIDYEHAMDRNRVMAGGRRQTQNQNIYDNEDLQMGGGRRYLGDLQRNQGQTVGRNMQEREHGINTVSANDARLLFVGRRRKDPNNVQTISGGNIHDNDDDDRISGGRRVSKEDKNEERQNKNKYRYEDDDKDSQYDSRRENSERYINVNRRGMLWDQNPDDVYNDLPWNMQQGRYGLNVNGRNNWRQQQIIDDDVYGNLYGKQGQGYGMGVGRGRNDFLNIVNRGQRQPFDNEQDLMWNQGGSLDMRLPTTSIDDERLLHISRHKLSNVEEGRRVSNAQQDLDDDDEYMIQTDRQGRSSQGNVRGQQQTNYQTNSYDANRRGNQNSDSYRGQNRETTGRRYRRSLINQQQNIDNVEAVTGKLLLYTIQQLVARLNVERIALGQPQLVDNSQNNLGQQGLLNHNMGGHLTISSNNIRDVDVHTVQKIEEILQRIDQVLEQRIGDISVMSYNQKVNEIGLLLAGQIEEIGLVQLLGEILQQGTVQQQHRKGQVANILENQGAQMLLAGIVKVIDNKVQQVYRTRKEFINTLEGVTIHDVDVDQLQTYLEYAEVDLSNLLKNNMDQSKEVIGRVPRLNHKNFKIEVDVTSDRQQQVVVRNLLVPKVDGLGNKIPLQERRQNVIVLDITTAQLNPGHNKLKLRSNDITLTARDTTPLTQIYQHVMQALNGNIQLPRNLLVGQTNRLPHRLLLPRGRPNGLPMQLITVITRVQQNSAGLRNQGTSSALDILLLDHLPLNYPLHCDITDLDGVINMPNLMVKDVKIYHDDNIQMHNY